MIARTCDTEQINDLLAHRCLQLVAFVRFFYRLAQVFITIALFISLSVCQSVRQSSKALVKKKQRQKCGGVTQLRLQSTDDNTCTADHT